MPGQRSKSKCRQIFQTPICNLRNDKQHFDNNVTKVFLINKFYMFGTEQN